MTSAGEHAMTSPSRRHGSVAPTPQQPITKPARHHARSRSPGSPSCAQRTLGGNLASAVTVHGARIGSGSVAGGGMCRRSGHCSRASSGSGSSSRLGCAAAVRLRVPSTVPPKASDSRRSFGCNRGASQQLGGVLWPVLGFISLLPVLCR